MSSASVLNPGLIPGSNVSGTNLTLPFQSQQGGQASLGGSINPLLPINTSTSTSYPTMPQSSVSTSATSGFPANSSPYTSGTVTAAPGVGGTGTLGTGPTGNAPGGLPGSGFSGLTGPQKDKLLKSLKGTYGSGLGTVLFSFLSGGAGYNTQAINNMIAQLQPGFNTQQTNLLQQFSAGGNRFGSGGQVGLADLLSQQGLEVGSIESQMYEDALNNYLSVIMGVSGPTAKRVASSPSIFDTIGSALGLGSSASSGLSSIISAINPGADTGLLDALGALG